MHIRATSMSIWDSKYLPNDNNNRMKTEMIFRRDYEEQYKEEENISIIFVYFILYGKINRKFNNNGWLCMVKKLWQNYKSPRSFKKGLSLLQKQNYNNENLFQVIVLKATRKSIFICQSITMPAAILQTSTKYYYVNI